MLKMMSAGKNVGIAVIGLGIAGSVRVRDLKENACGFTLQGVVSRRPVENGDMTSLTLDEALACKDVGAIIICTENKTHEEYIQRGLENGKHVLVEYPIALSSSKAKQLYSLAEEKGLILWEENIALLTDSHKLVKKKLEQTAIKSVTFSISGSYNGWIEKLEDSGYPFTSGVSSIETMVDLFGELNVVSGEFKQAEDGYSAIACLETGDKKPINITLSRKQTKERFRKKSAVFEFMDGEVIDLDKITPKPPSKPGLFMQDLLSFYQAVVEGKNDEAAKKRTLHSLEIADKVHYYFKQ